MPTIVNPKEITKWLTKKSLYDFIKEFWDAFDDTSPYIDSWLVEFTSECYMYSVKHFLPNYIWRDWISDDKYEQIKKETNGICPVRDKMINGNHTHNHDWNIGPRHMKSTILNICGPVWTAINVPIKIASVSHTAGLSTEMNAKRQKLINSDKFKYYFNSDVDLRLVKDSAKSLIMMNGSELYSVCQTSFTGFGADIIIADDLISSDNAKKDMMVLRNAVSFFRSTLPTRLNNKTTGVTWQIQQRLGMGDISGTILSDKGLKQIYSHTEIQAIADHDITYVYPCTGKVKVIKKGDLLWPERFGDYSIIKMEVGEDFETQYNQRPAASKLNIIKDDYIHYIDDEELELFKTTSEFHYGSHDCPVKEYETSDYHGFCEGYSKGNDLVITDAFERHLGYIKEKELMINLNMFDPGMIQIVEDKANGAALLQDLKGDVPGLDDFQPGTRSKSQRLELASVYMKNGAVRFKKGSEAIDYLIQQLKKFPLLEHDDIVDAFSQLVLYHFTSKKLGVYTGAFTYQNIIPDIIRDYNNFTHFTYAATINGDIIKVIGISTDNSRDIYTVEKEFIFRGVQSFHDFCTEEIKNGNTFLDASIQNSLSSIINNIYALTKFIDKDRPSSINALRSGFFSQHVKVCAGCKGTISDIAKLRVTETSRDQGVDKTDTLDEGYAGCLRAFITYMKGTNAIWY